MQDALNLGKVVRSQLAQSIGTAREQLLVDLAQTGGVVGIKGVSPIIRVLAARKARSSLSTCTSGASACRNPIIARAPPWKAVCERRWVLEVQVGRSRTMQS